MGESSAVIGGDGAYSYKNNSQFQKQASDSAKEMIQEAIIEKLDKEILSTTLGIADFGCSVGPNTFFAMQNVIEAVENKCSLQGLDSKNIEFQVFFSDQTKNDFNTLFRTLPLDRKYHAAGVPGSFYGRLFPRASISLVYSAYALNWLSKEPEGVSDSKSLAWNQGRIHYTGASVDVVNAYSDQFGSDMGVFLNARSQEIVKGGLMFLILPGIPEGVCPSQLVTGAMFNHLGSILMDLANEGVIDKSEIDAFNLSTYFPTLAEVTKLIEKNGCFNIERTELTNVRHVDAHNLIMHIRAGIGGILTKHFGTSVEEKLFTKALAKAEELSQLLEVGHHITPQMFVALKRK